VTSSCAGRSLAPCPTSADSHKRRTTKYVLHGEVCQGGTGGSIAGRTAGLQPSCRPHRLGVRRAPLESVCRAGFRPGAASNVRGNRNPAALGPLCRGLPGNAERIGRASGSFAARAARPRTRKRKPARCHPTVSGVWYAP
jgi:hypothetical protein